MKILKLRIKMFWFHIASIFGIVFISVILIIITIFSPLTTAKCIAGMGKEVEKSIARIEKVKKEQ